MSRTIDERIVQMTFKNEEFESRAKTTLSTLANLKDVLTGQMSVLNFGGIARSVDSIGTNFSGLYSSVETVKNGFSALEAIAVGALLNIGRKAEDTGARLIKSLTVDNISGGWKKYEEQTASVQTLVNSTGKSVDEIDTYLDRLMWYSDETSFGFTDMTKALGTMVSSGGDIDKLIPMLMGIGNATAYAGKGASEFQRVIYNLNQSYSTGALKTMDWRSIELAGVDSKVLKEQLLGAAEELKTITKEQNKLSNFSSLLSDGVFTRDVMEKAFSSFAEMTIEAEKLVDEGKFDTAAEAIDSLSGKYAEFAERAFRSAQEAKSFREAIDATKDAVSSGWMQTFKLIFGNYEESKALWTDVTESFWDWFASGAETRNTVFENWKELWSSQVDFQKELGWAKKLYNDESLVFVNLDDSLTQTQALWKAFSDTITKIRDDISSVWKSVFPPDLQAAAQKIFNAIETVRNGLLNFSEFSGDSTVYQSLLKVAEALFRSFKALINIGKTFIDSFVKPLAEKLKPILTEIMEIFGAIGDRVSAAADGISKDSSPLVKIFDGILRILDPVINLIGNFVSKIHELVAIDEETEKVSIFTKVFESLGEVLQFIAGVFNGAIDVFKELGSILSGVFDKLKEIAGNFLESNGMDLSKFAGGGLIGFLGILGFGLAKAFDALKKLDFKAIFKKITSFFGGEGKGFLGTIKETFETLTDGIKTFTESIKVKVLESIGNSLIKLAAALLIMSLIDSEKAMESLIGLGFALGEMLLAMKVFEKFDTKNFSSSAGAISKIATALLIMSIALKIFSTIDPETMMPTLASLGVLLAELFAFVVATAKLTETVDPKNIKSIGKLMSSIGFSLIEISIALKIMSTMNPNEMTNALLSFGAALLGIGLFIVAVGKSTKEVNPSSLKAIGSAMLNISAGLLVLTAALWILSKIDTKGLNNGMTTILASLLLIGLFVAAVAKIGASKFVGISLGMLVFAAALIPLAVALGLLGNIKLTSLAKGIGALAAVLVIFGIAGALLAPIAPQILILSGALLVFSLASIAVSAALVIAAGAFTILANAIAALGQLPLGALIQGLVGLAASLVIFGFLGAVLSVLAPQILFTSVAFLAFGAALNVVALGIVEMVAAFSVLGEAVTGFWNWLTGSSAPKDAGKTNGEDYVDSVKESFNSKKQELMDASNELNNIAADSMDNSDGAAAGANLTLDTLISTLDSRAPDVLASGQNLSDYFGEGFMSGDMSMMSANFEQYLSQIPQSANIEGLGYDSGLMYMTNYITGEKDKESEAVTTAEEIGKNTGEAMDATEEAQNSATNMADGFLTTLRSYLPSVEEVGRSYSSAFTNSLNYEAQIKSPSRVTMKSGKYLAEGLILGLSDKLSAIKKSGFEAGSVVTKAIQSAMDIANSIVDDSTPVISPVLDLSNVTSQAGNISSLFGGTSLNSAMSISAQNGLQNQNGVILDPEININFTVNNAGGELTDIDIERFSKTIANRVNIELGRLL